jgi:hypothetical protein
LLARIAFSTPASSSALTSSVTKAEMQRILDTPTLTRNTFEMARAA